MNPLTIRTVEELHALMAVYPKVADVLPKPAKVAEGNTRKYMGAICSLPTQAELEEEQQKATTIRRDQEFFKTLVPGKTGRPVDPNSGSGIIRQWLSDHNGDIKGMAEAHPELKTKMSGSSIYSVVSKYRRAMGFR